MQNIKSRMARASLWISVSRAATSVLTIISTIILARLLLPADFGIVALAMTIVAVLTAMTQTSMASAIIHLKNPTDDHYHTAWTLGVGRGIVLALILALIARPVSNLYRAPELEDVIYFLTLTALMTGAANPRLIKLQKQLIFRQVFYVTVTQSVVTLVASVALAYTYRSYWGIVMGTVAGQAASLAVSYMLFPFRPRFSLKHFRELWSFSMWTSLSQIVNTVNYRFDHLLIGAFLSRSMLGYYSVGSRLANLASRETVLPLTQVLFPAFSLVSGEQERLRQAYQRSQATVTALALPAGIGLALIAEPLVLLAMGEHWRPAVAVVQVLASLYAVQTLIRLANPLAMAIGQTQLLFRRSLQMFLLRLPLVSTGMYLWGFSGLLAGRLVAGVAAILINMHMVRTLIGVPYVEQLRVNGRCFGATLAMIGAMTGVKSLLAQDASTAGLALAVVVSIVAGAAAYLAATALLWLVQGRPRGPETEAAELLRRFRRRGAKAPVAPVH